MSGKGDGGVGARSVVGVRLVPVVCDYGVGASSVGEGEASANSVGDGEASANSVGEGEASANSVGVRLV